MAIEIERKFLVKIDSLPKLDNGKKTIQGYFSKDPSVRVSIVGTVGRITVKSSGTLTRKEFEYIIPVKDAEEMLTLCNKTINKIRYKINYGGRAWEIDEFFGNLLGFWMAEVEIESEDAIVELPNWIYKEVTGDERYMNINLIDSEIPL